MVAIGKCGKARDSNAGDRASNGAPKWHLHLDILYVLVGRGSGTEARQARRETSGIRPDGPAIEEVLAAGEDRGFPPRGRSREAACGA
jgi:hypothetical protein